MARYSLIVLTNAAPGADNDFNAWYDNVDIPDLLRIPGVIAAQRSKLAPSQLVAKDGGFEVVCTGDAALVHCYLALYSIESNDIQFVYGQ